ncbi:MAG: serine/threonine protein kinase [Chloroflexi bacterium]|nr:serine/threonine protein kinase [Chloroflexota bacterium]
MPDQQLRSGDIIGGYLLQDRLGEGAMGVVYRAIRLEDQLVVALKVMQPSLSLDPTYQRRFAHEARLAAEIRHPHLVSVVDSGEAVGRQFMAVAYVPGTSLAALIEGRGALALADAIRLAEEIGSALDALHAGGILHRDVKPPNVLIDNVGKNYLSDFGLAKGRALTALTRPGELIGTLEYMAPEIVRGDPAEPASDVYSLGCLVYEAMVGRTPFGSKRGFQIAAAHLGEPPPDPSELRGELGRGLAAAVLEALRKDPSERPSGGLEYARSLRSAADGRHEVDATGYA